MRFDKLIYERGNTSSEAQRIEFEMPTGMNVYEFKLLCKRMAAALGYSDTSIKDAFDSTNTIEQPSKKQILKG